MKKTILPALAILSLPLAAQAQDAEKLKLEIGGHFKLYTNFTEQDETAGNGCQFGRYLRDTDIGFLGETTLDNGLTVGMVVNADGDVGSDFDVEDSFAYLSGNWGRVSAGAEDGAAYIIQVAAPSADENIDGIETFINPINYTATDLNGTNFETQVSAFGLDYGQDRTAGFDKITYISPVFSGFQAGFSYTPTVGNFDISSRGDNGNALDAVSDEYGAGYDAALRYEYEIGLWHLALGGGYSRVTLEDTAVASTLDDFNEWNTGAQIQYGDWAFGGAYAENNGGEQSDADQETWTLGVNYTIGEMRLGASYLNKNVEEGASGDIDADRYTAGMVYVYAPGVNFRGSVSQVEISAPDAISGDVSGTSMLLGTEILF